MQDVIAYVDANRSRFVDDLIEWVRIPSVSSDPKHTADVARNAEHLANTLRSLGAGRVEVWPTAGHPAVFAEWMRAPGKPTLLVYGHHDVQPVDPLNEWVTPPFEPSMRGGRLWGRGVVDDKGQVFIHAKAIEAFVKTVGELPINLRMIVEGEEEVGSLNLDILLRERAADLAADFVCVSDTAMFGRGIPSLCVGLRGLAYVEVFVDGPALDLHSGSFGGGVTNPVNALARMLGTLHDDDGRITVEGFYEHVLPLKDHERREIESLPFDEKEWLRSTGAPAVFGEKGYSTLERIWARPTLDVCGISGGFQGEGAKTIIPARASAKVSCRLVPDQDPAVIAQLVEAHFARVAPPGVRVTVTALHGGRPWRADLEGPIYDAARRALTAAFRREPVIVGEGGSIPVVADFVDALDAPVLLVGFGLPGENAHAPDEWMSVENFELGMRAVATLWDLV